MTLIREIYETHPYKMHEKYNSTNIAKCVEKCFECSSSSWICADACLSEDHVSQLIDCVKISFSCSQVCLSTAHIITVQHNLTTLFVRQQISSCLEVCKACAIECEKHQDLHDHCKISARICRECESMCQYLLYQSKLQ